MTDAIKFTCHIGKDKYGYFWQAENFPNVLVSNSYELPLDAKKDCERFMKYHKFKFKWEKK